MNRAVQNAEEYGVVENVESFELLANHIGEFAGLINNEIIYFDGGGSGAYFEIDEFLHLVEETKEKQPTREDPIKRNGFVVTRSSGGHRLRLHREMSTSGDFIGTTNICKETIQDIKDRFRL